MKERDRKKIFEEKNGQQLSKLNENYNPTDPGGSGKERRSGSKLFCNILILYMMWYNIT